MNKLINLDYENDTFSKRGINESQKKLAELQIKSDNLNSEIDNISKEIYANTKTVDDLVHEKQQLQRERSTIIADQKQNNSRPRFGVVTVSDIESQINIVNQKLINLHSEKTKLGNESQKLKRNKSALDSTINDIKKRLKNLQLKRKAARMMQQMNITTGKSKTKKKIASMHTYNRQIIPEYEDSENLSNPVIITSLGGVFDSIDRNIKTAFKTTRFMNGESDQIYVIIPSIFDIRLNYERLDNDDLIKIRFIQPGENKRSCIRMNITKKQQDTMVIERVRLLEKQFFISCYLYLALVLCTFIRVNVVELMDTVDQLQKESTNSASLNHRHKKYTDFFSTGIPDKYTSYIYPHHLSYFSDYGFVDKYYNKYKPIFSNCSPMNSPDCETSEQDIDDNLDTDDVTKTTFIFMERKMSMNDNEYYKNLSDKLENIKLSGLTPEQLCKMLPCMGNVFDGECTTDGYFKLIVSDFTSTPTETTTPTTNKFGYGTNTFNMFPYSANF